MRKMMFILLAIMVIAGASAQTAFFPSKAGMVLTYANKDKKGKVQGYNRLTIKEVTGSGNNMTISYLSEVLDKNQKQTDQSAQIPFTVTIKNGVLIMDLKSMFANIPGQDKQNSDMKLQIEGIPSEIPSNLQPGDALKDSNVSMTVDLGIAKMKTMIAITEGKCLAIEDATVPGGTFKCHKITQKATATMMKMKTTSRTLSWYAPGTGTVKVESYDEKGNLQTTQELISVKS